MNSTVNTFIKSLGNINDINDSYEIFKQIFTRHSPTEWLDMHVLLDYSNAISRFRPDLLPVGIRLNVQVNLFLRTIDRFDKYKLNIIKDSIGCFGLTEYQAGVLSGLKINTYFSEVNDGYILEPHINDYKNWISQGMTADYILIFAKNKLTKQVSIFLCKFSEIGNMLERENKVGPRVCDYLDVAKIQIIDNIKLNKESILLGTKTIEREKLLNGIYYGRWMISEAILWAIYGLIEHCERKINNFNKLNFLQNLLDNERNIINHYIDLMKRNRKNINNIHIVNSFKIKTVHVALESYYKISRKFGSHVLDYPLKYEDILLNKIAEGDTNVLRLSLVSNDMKSGILKSQLRFHYLVGYLNKDYIIKNSGYFSDLIIDTNLSKL